MRAALTRSEKDNESFSGVGVRARRFFKKIGSDPEPLFFFDVLPCSPMPKPYRIGILVVFFDFVGYYLPDSTF